MSVFYYRAVKTFPLKNNSSADFSYQISFSERHAAFTVQPATGMHVDDN